MAAHVGWPVVGPRPPCCVRSDGMGGAANFTQIKRVKKSVLVFFTKKNRFFMLAFYRFGCLAVKAAEGAALFRPCLLSPQPGSGREFFFTVNLYDPRSDLLVKRVDVLRGAVRRAWVRAPFHIDAFVVLPEHLHWVWAFPAGDVDFSVRWNAIKRSALEVFV